MYIYNFQGWSCFKNHKIILLICTNILWYFVVIGKPVIFHRESVSRLKNLKSTFFQPPFVFPVYLLHTTNVFDVNLSLFSSNAQLTLHIHKLKNPEELSFHLGKKIRFPGKSNITGKHVVFQQHRRDGR